MERSNAPRYAICGALGLLAAACSGAGNQDLFDGVSAESDVSETTPPSSSESGSTPGSSGGTSGAESGKTPPGGTTPPAPPAEKCVKEKEPNDDVRNASAFTTCLSGKIDSNGDVDYGTFVVPAGTKATAWTHKESGGKATYRFFLDGIPLGTDPGEDGALRLVAGGKYNVRVTSNQNGGGGGSKPTWELNLTFTK